MKRKPHPSDELLGAVVDAVLDGDEERFPELNDRYDHALGEGVEVGHRGKKVKVSFGAGEGTRAEWRETVVDCPDCGKTLRSRGMTFTPGPDAPAEVREAFDAFDDEAMELETHRYPFKGWTGCPAHKWRHRISGWVTIKPIRKVAHVGLGYAWRNLRWDHPIEGPIYRVLKAKETAMWKTCWFIRRAVGWIEQPLWNRRHP